MAQTATIIRVLISCPGDVECEKALVRRICEEINRNWGSYFSIRLEAFEWKTDVVPHFGPRPQDVINEQVGEYEVHIGILWRRFGSPTGIKNPVTGEEFKSGTEEEFFRAHEQWKSTELPLINMFFKSPGDPPQSPDEIDQFSRLVDFKEKLKESGLVVEFSDEREFEDKIRQFLSDVVKKSGKIKELQQLKAPFPPVAVIAKQSYPDVENYIPRKVVKADEAGSTKLPFLLERHGKDLLEVIQKAHRILLVGEAGIGKSSELQRIAHELSKADSAFVPILASLNKYVQQGLADYLPASLSQIPPERAVIIMDGLDEVESQNRNAAIRQIELYAGHNPLARIIVSCRNNLSQPIEGFETYDLTELSGWDIEDYIHSRLGVSRDDFNRQVFDLEVQDLLKNPFYLTNLVNSFLATNSLPRKKTEIIRSFIETRFNIDESKYRTTVTDFAEKKRMVLQTLERLSLTMEVLGRNYLSQDEFVKVVPDDVERDIIKHSGLLKRHESEGVTWQFEHNNFQEYLAAVALSRQTIDTIKEFAAFKPDFRKTKPSWLNALSFLFNLPEKDSKLFSELLNWIMLIEQELLVKFEPGSVELSRRIQIFKKIFEDYKKKGIWIDHVRFQYRQLARFAESDEALDYLLNEIKASTNDVVTGNAIYLLRFMTIPPDFQAEVKKVLLQVILQPSKQSFTRARTLNALTEMELGSKEVADVIVPALRPSDDTWIRYSLYHFLYSTGLQDEYVDVFLEGIPYIRMELRDSKNRDIRLGDENYHLRIGLQRVTTPASLVKILEYFKSRPKEIHLSFFTDDLPFIVENAAKAYEEEPSIFDHMFSLFLVLVAEHQEKEAGTLLSFFDMTKTRARAFMEVYRTKRSDPDWYVPLATLAAPDTIEFFIDEYMSNNLTNDNVWTFRNFIGWKNRPLYDLFHARVNERTGNKFELPKPRDFEAERKKRFADDIKMLFNRQAFLEAIKLIYDHEGKDRLTKEYLREVRIEHWEDHYFSDIAMDTLEDTVEAGAMTYDEIKNLITTRWDWDYFSILEIHRFMAHGREVELDQDQTELIRKWCLSNIDKVDFKTALRKNEQGGTSTSHMAVILWSFIRKLSFDYPKNVLLDMLSFDWVEGTEMGGIRYLEERLTKNEIAQRILENLDKGVETDDVLKNHLDFCHRHGIREVIPFAVQTIEDGSRDQNVRRAALETILSFPGASNVLEEPLQNILDDFKWRIVEKLVKLSSERCRSFLLDVLRNGQDEEKFKASEFLVELQDIDGLRYYVDYVKQTKKSPVDSFRGSPIGKLSEKESIPLLLELLEVTYHEDFVQDEFERFDGAIRASLENIAIANGEYDLVKESVERFIETNLAKYPRVSFLHAFLESLQRAYYINKNEQFTLEEALALAKKIV